MTDVDFERGQALLAACDDSWPAERVALVIFTPGCLVAGQLRYGLELVERAGFMPVFGRPIRFTQPLVRRVWRYQLRTFRPDRWRLIVDLLLAGPSFLTVWVDEQPGTGSAAQRMTALKGPSDPLLGTPGQLRTELGGMNKIINLLHCAQETDDVVRESAILLDDAEFTAAWSKSSQPVAEQFRPWWPEAALGRRDAGVSFVHTAAALRRRVIEALAWRLSPEMPASVGGFLREETDLLASLDPLRPLAALASYRQRFAGRPVTALLAAALDDAPEDDGSNALWGQALAELDGALLADRCDLERLWCVLDQVGCGVDEWERLIVATQQVTADMSARG